MSQSDYIKFKRISTELRKGVTEPVLSAQNYIDFKQYNIENNIVSTKPDYRQPSLLGVINIFDINRNVLFCPMFNTCSNTNTRPNRVPLPNVYFTPKYVPKYVKHPVNEKNQCDCRINTKPNDKFAVCRCKKEY